MRTSIASGGPQHRIPKIVAHAGPRAMPAADHPAIKNGHTLFPGSVIHASLAPRVLISGHNSRKIGKIVTKGRWRGFEIYTLTLEERATCPRSCLEWRTCYGNNMHWSRRHMAGSALERSLRIELSALAKRHPRGFVVRLHVLGDFYSVDYVRFWRDALSEIPQLRVFGYTARDFDDPIGNEVMNLSLSFPLRCRIRFSGTDAGGLGSLVIGSAAESRHVICPAQMDKTDCCATCALCWSMDQTVDFLRH